MSSSALLDDGRFDDELPATVQHHAAIHFTPVDVARFATGLLVSQSGTRVLDVGSGAGKFCLVAASTAPTATFVGVEIRPHLVDISQQLAARHGLRNVRFIHADAFALDWSVFDAFYFYNPFAEQHHTTFVMDRSIDLAPANFDRYVAEVQRRLRVARVGTRVVTFHGLGGAMPPGWMRTLSYSVCSGSVELWIRRKGWS
jgi:SAM-dependent methyltransferase